MELSSGCGSRLIMEFDCRNLVTSDQLNCTQVFKKKLYLIFITVKLNYKPTSGTER